MRTVKIRPEKQSDLVGYQDLPAVSRLCKVNNAMEAAVNRPSHTSTVFYRVVSSMQLHRSRNGSLRLEPLLLKTT